MVIRIEREIMSFFKKPYPEPQTRRRRAVGAAFVNSPVNSGGLYLQFGAYILYFSDGNDKNLYGSYVKQIIA